MSTQILRKHLAFISGITQAVQAHLSPTAKIIDVNIGNDSSPDKFEAEIRVAFGPTHKLSFKFTGSVDEAEHGLGKKWSLHFHNDGVTAEVGITGDANATTAEEDKWKLMRTKLGLPELPGKE